MKRVAKFFQASLDVVAPRRSLPTSSVTKSIKQVRAMIDEYVQGLKIVRLTEWAKEIEGG